MNCTHCIIDIMLSKNDCSVKEMKDFVATYRTRLAVLYKRGGGLSGDKHLKSGLC